jgi:cellulose synthase (UDP-forming)
MPTLTSRKDFFIRLFTASIFIFITFAGLAFAVYLILLMHSVYQYIIAIAFLILSIISGVFNVIAASWYYKSYFLEEYIKNIKKNLKPLKRLPTVAIVMPTHDENLKMIRKNVISLTKVNYPKNKYKIYVLNDLNDPNVKIDMEKMCSELGVNFIYRDNNRAFKAGALNNFLKYSNEEFIAIFDADEYLIKKNFLLDNIPYFQNEKLSFVQTEKKYAKGTFFSDSVDISDNLFFRFVESARTFNNTAIFAGSCGIIRRSALEKIGGFPEYIVEDTFLSFESDMHNYKGLYIPKVYALGKPINTFSKLVNQQSRYSYGLTQFIPYMLKRKTFDKKSKSTGMNYLAHGIGLSYISTMLISFTIISVALIFFYFPIFNITLSTLFTNSFNIIVILGLLAFFMSIIMPVMLSKIYYNSISKGIMVFLLNYSLSFTRLYYALTAILKRERKFKWTNKSNTKRASIIRIVSATKVELTFAFALFSLSIFLLLHYNFSGSAWLVWYGMLFLLTPIFFYKYK